MLRRESQIWAGFLAVTLVATATHLRADDQKDTGNGKIVVDPNGARIDTQNDPDGTRLVKLNVGGKTVPVKVQDAPNPFQNLHQSSDSSGKYDPRRIFSQTDPMANKVFDMPTGTFAKSDEEDKNKFVTKSYLDPNSQNTFRLPAAETRSSSFTKGNHDFDRDYPTSSVDNKTQNAAFIANATSDEQNRTSNLNGAAYKEDLPVDPMANKQYLGPGAQKVPEDVLVKENIVLTRVHDIPNRPLTIDEVRNLINNDQKPNLNEKPDEPSKALNDPNYQPEPLRGDTSPPPLPSGLRPIDDDKDDLIPGPGMMAAPENTDPLPQKH